MSKRSNVLLIFSKNISDKIFKKFENSNKSIQQNIEEYFQPTNYEIDDSGNLLLYFSGIIWQKQYEEINFLQFILNEVKNQPKEYLFAQKTYKNMNVKGSFYDAPFNFSIDDKDINLFTQKEQKFFEPKVFF